jgi:hypothetical protein
MTGLKTLTIIAVLLAGGVSIASAQNGLPTGGYPPVAGGANGNPAIPSEYQRSTAPVTATHLSISHHRVAPTVPPNH